MNLLNNKKLGSRPKSFEHFKQEAELIHGDKYDYSDFVYVNNKTKGKIHCKTCGYTFEMIPSNHICKKQGCPRCEKRLKYTTEECIEKCKETHGDKYDYSKTEYINGNTKICIICPIHGSFWQKPLKHWIGQGCPKCNQSHLERDVENLLKELNIEYKYQATKKDLQFLEMKSLDFYIPSLKIGIECQGIQHFEDNGFLKSKKVIERDIDKFNSCADNNVHLVYYTNLEDKVKNNQFYSDKTIFMNINNLRKYLNNYETAN